MYQQLTCNVLDCGSVTLVYNWHRHQYYYYYPYRKQFPCEILDSKSPSVLLSVCPSGVIYVSVQNCSSKESQIMSSCWYYKYYSYYHSNFFPFSYCLEKDSSSSSSSTVIIIAVCVVIGVVILLAVIITICVVQQSKGSSKKGNNLRNTNTSRIQPTTRTYPKQNYNKPAANNNTTVQQSQPVGSNGVKSTAAVAANQGSYTQAPNHPVDKFGIPLPAVYIDP